MLDFRPLPLCAVGTTLLLAACGGEPSGRPGGGPLALASDAPFCEPVVTAVRAAYEAQAAARPVPDDPRYGGTVVVAGGADLTGGFNGLTTQDQTTQETELHLVHVTLLSFDVEREPRPYLAESWTLDDDGRGATIQLRPDMRWHDGEPVTAHDVAFTYRRAMDPATAFPNSGWFAFYDPEAIEVIDDHTLRFGFEPHAETLDPWASLSIMPEHLLGDVAPEALREHPFGTECPVGAGPYLFEAYRPGDQWVLRANPAFPEELGGRPFIDRYVYRVITTSSTRVGELVAGGVDVALGIDPVDAATVTGREGLRLEDFDQRAFAFVGWNTRLPGLADTRVRRAMTSAIDRGSLVQTLRGGYASVAETGVPDFHWAHDPSLQGPSYDPDAARSLLEAAGWTDRNGDGVREDAAGNELRFSIVTNANTEREGIGRILRDQLGDVGVAVELTIIEMGALQSRVLVPGARDFGGFILGWAHDFNINERDFFHSEAAESHPYGWSGISDPALDRLLDTLPAIRDRDAARPFWRAYQERIVELQPFTYLYFSRRLNGVDADLRGLEMDIRGELVSAPLWYWQPAPSP
jgi:peptide/nickel transport system substrate-binding protein